MVAMFTFEKLTVYKDSILLASEVYALTKLWPRDELFGLTNQFRRAVVSISLNIAEGSGRTKKDFCHFLDIARASGLECIPILEISLLEGLITKDQFDFYYARFERLSKQISALKKSISD